jgi:hypothetical protein
MWQQYVCEESYLCRMTRGHYAAALSAAIVFAESAVIRATACTLADELMVLRAPAPRAA